MDTEENRIRRVRFNVLGESLFFARQHSSLVIPFPDGSHITVMSYNSGEKAGKLDIHLTDKEGNHTLLGGPYSEESFKEMGPRFIKLILDSEIFQQNYSMFNKYVIVPKDIEPIKNELISKEKRELVIDITKEKLKKFDENFVRVCGDNIWATNFYAPSQLFEDNKRIGWLIKRNGRVFLLSDEFIVGIMDIAGIKLPEDIKLS
ncbi:MAG: hypothetical protein CSMARM4_0050 [Candidatus Parvarchaeum acidiphilum ARMAN-4_'5-way FS']|jgi:hypothetical protein|uniref:Uncharacterized protein n=1 Tax=Candidatus Parvarchaeum acidiphilum ARMAN-4_'5-way FS' TaxID=994837 RepID=F2UTX0_PARA4|nr:MAG: hypothetical protein CSMARM4_0050 [Candidatus Parvarchaeum acidiphilum ARMAN-4_'5-way FS']